MIVTLEMLRNNLQCLGISAGDNLFVHSSLSSFGRLAGGAEIIIDVLNEIVGDEGNLAFPTFTYSFAGEFPPYHPLRTSSRIGIVPEFFRFRKGVIRSVHPTHSVAALGLKAEYIIGSHREMDSPCGRNSPFARLLEISGKVLFLGCPVSSNTTIHAIEEWAGLPYAVESTKNAVLVDDNGNLKKVEIPCVPAGHRDFYKPNSKIERAFNCRNIIKKAQISSASIQLIEMRDIFEVTLGHLFKCPDFLLCEQGDCEFCRQKRAVLLDEKEVIRVNIERLKSELLV